MDRIRMGGALILGTSTHQSKGREWPNVDYVTDLIPSFSYQLDQLKRNDRHKYVALARAKDTVRVRPLPAAVLRQMRFE